MEDYKLVVHLNCNNLVFPCSTKAEVKEVLVKCAKARANFFPFGLFYKGEWLWYNERFDRYGYEADDMKELSKEGRFELATECLDKFFEEDEAFVDQKNTIDEKSEGALKLECYREAARFAIARGWISEQQTLDLAKELYEWVSDKS